MIYVHQYGGWWGFRPAHWRKWVTQALEGMRSGAGYTLPRLCQLQNRPKCAKRWDRERNWWQSEDPRHQILHPLDWDLSDWEDYVKENNDK